ncbi:MAG: ComEC/Rec2 family competence protein [Patescibacteria group bacterium]
MTWRLVVLASVLLSRLLGNLALTSRYRLGEPVRVRFDPYKIVRTRPECVISSGVFWLKNEDVCNLPQAGAVDVTGSFRASLIDRLLGRIWLEESSHYTIEPIGQLEKSYWLAGAERIANFRVKLSETTLARLPSPEGELVLGIVMGYKSILPKLFYEQLVNSGTVHIVVASGYNVMVVAGLALSAMLLFWRRRVATLAAIGVVWLYVLLAGGEVSLLRAALMGSVVLIGLAWGRSSRIIWSLVAVAGVMLVVSPLLIENVSFQLSVAATFGVAVVGPFLKDRWARDDPVDVTTTLGALLMTAPLIWWHFGRVSWMSLISNSLILPLIPLVMALGGITMVLALALPALATVVSWPTYALAHLVVVLIGIFG